MAKVTWNKLRVGDTVVMAHITMTLVDRAGHLFTWFMHDIQQVHVIDYTNVDLDVPVNQPHCALPTTLIGRIKS